MEIKENLEGKKTDNLEATSASENPEVDLASPTVPNETEVEDANFPAGVESVTDEPVANETAEINENVDADNAVNGNIEPVEDVPVENIPVIEENGVTETPALKMFTQSQVNDMMGGCRTETREKTFRYIYDRYGVNSEEELDSLIGNAQRYDSLHEQYEGDKKLWKDNSAARDKELADVKEQVALMQSGIDNSRYEDAKFILNGKGLEITVENINNELATHPEWKKGGSEANTNFTKIDTPAEPASEISVLGNEGTNAKVNNEEDYALGRLFKV